MSLDQRPPAPADGPQRPGAAELEQERRDLSGVIGSPLTQSLRLAALVAVVVALGVWRGLPTVIVVLAIVVMIFLHELGHYLAARWSGMKATEFFIGFGPKIWSFRRGETEFGFKAIPAGAYVKILGMNNLEEVDPADEPRTYRQARFRDRLNVAVAGSAMHFLVALVLLFVQFAFIGRADGDRWEIGAVTEGSAAEAAGLEVGDRILRLDGEPVGTFDAFRSELTGAQPGRIELVVQRDGERVVVPVDLSQRVKIIGTIGEDLDLIDSGDGVVVGSTLGSGEAARSGLEEGAAVVAVNGRPVDGLDDVAGALERSVGGVVTVATRVDGTTEDHRVDLGSDLAAGEPAAFLGVGSQAVLVTDPVPAAAGNSVAEFGRLIGANVAGIGRIFWPPNLVEFASSAFSGPEDATDAPTAREDVGDTGNDTRPMSIVGAVIVGADMTEASLSNLILFLIGLNITIGVLNLIPLLPLDGGHVAIAVYEKAQELRLRRRQRYIADVSRMIPVAMTVIMVLVALFLIAGYVDVTRGVPS